MKIVLLVITALFLLFQNRTEAQISSAKRPKIGLVLSGGGAKGIAHIGVLKVLEEAGVPIDFIGGTSMGSIVGGLYAIGYSARQLDSLVRIIDWEDLLGDKISRRSLTMIEKDEDIKYIFSFPIREKKIALPSGIVAGQNISELFSRLTNPVYNITDFSKFKIPYLCVATDIEKGEAVVLKEGILADAMRASMAIPTIFTPEEIDGRLLLDGGLINNFPVEDVKKMGADIIIGVDVGFRYYKQEELNSIVKIIEQSVFMHSKEQNQQRQKMCNILIIPDLIEYNARSFNKADSLIARGEKAARQQYDKIKELATYLHSFDDSVKPQPHIVKPIDEFYVKKIEITGLKNVPKEFVLRRLPFEISNKIKLADIDKAIERLYGTWFFERITYSLEPIDEGVVLHFMVIEKSTNYFRVGLHYDSDNKTTLLLNTTFRNLIVRGSKITIDLALGENPLFSGLLYKNTGWNPRHYFLSGSKLVPDFGLKLRAFNLQLYQYDNDQRIASYNFTDVTTDLFLQGNLSNNNVFDLGILGDFASISNRINYDKKNSNAYYINIYGCYKKDSYNQAFYPSHGGRIMAKLNYVKGLSEGIRTDKGFIVASFRSNLVIPLSKKFSLNQGLFGGTIVGDSVPTHYQFLLGGLGGSYLQGMVPFVGMNFMQQANLHALVTGLDLQWQVWKDNFFMVKANIGKTVADPKNMLFWSDIAVGYGAAFGYRSPIGPMELTVMSSNKRTGITVFLNIGYWF